MASVFRDVQEFIEAHRDCGSMSGHAQPPTAKGYRLCVVCTCGEMLDRYVTPESAHHDLIFSDLLVTPN